MPVPSTAGTGSSDSVTTRDGLRADKARLEAELRGEQFRLQRQEALEAETQRLRALRDSTAGVTSRFVIGDVMDLDLDAFRERVLVNKGAGDGVYVGQAASRIRGFFGLAPVSDQRVGRKGLHYSRRRVMEPVAMRGGGCGGNWSLSCWIRSLSSGSGWV